MLLAYRYFGLELIAKAGFSTVNGVGDQPFGFGERPHRGIQFGERPHREIGKVGVRSRRTLPCGRTPTRLEQEDGHAHRSHLRCRDGDPRAPAPTQAAPDRGGQSGQGRREWLVDLEHGKPTVELGLVMQTLTTLGLEINLRPTEAPPTWTVPLTAAAARGPRRPPATVRPAKRGENARRRGRPRRIAPDRNDGLRKDFRCRDTQRESAGATRARPTLDGTGGTTTP